MKGRGALSIPTSLYENVLKGVGQVMRPHASIQNYIDTFSIKLQNGGICVQR